MNRKMKIVVIVIGVIVLVLISFAAGLYCGLIYGSYSNDKDLAKWSKLHEALDIRTESYYPSCQELNAFGIPKLVKKDNDYFFVHTTEDYFYVFGINIDPGNPPQMSWWGGGRKESIRQVCEKK